MVYSTKCSHRLFLLILLVGFFATDLARSQSPIQIYGYFATRFEKTFLEPYVENGNVKKEDAVGEFSWPYFNIMMQQNLSDQFKVYINLNGSGAENLGVRNFWGEYSNGQHLNVRFGKIYRKFGLYNEILDAVPTYYGIEPPELFDNDHLMLSRETIFMLYGGVDLGPGTLNYSFSTDNGEGGPFESVWPIGFDFNYALGNDFKIGTSGFVSGKNALSDVSMGDGSPKNGVLPWMSNDDFSVMGGYVQAQLFDKLTLQAEFWTSSHKATRDPASVLMLIQNTNINKAQRERFLKSPSVIDEFLTEDDINTVGDYDISTWYFRAGYSFETSIGEIAPYLQWDYYSNPETIAKKTYGGDNEAGVADDGIFNKSTIGIVYRPIYQIAIKLDQSYHFYRLNGENVNYPEIRFDVSYTFGL